MAESHDGVTPQGESRVVSPELALVDPGLAVWARDRLPAPSDSLARVSSIPGVSSRPPDAASLAVASPERIPGRSERPLSAGRRRKRLAIRAGVVAVVVTAFLADIPDQFRKIPASVGSSELSGLLPEADESGRPFEPRGDTTTGTHEPGGAPSRSVTATTTAPDSVGVPSGVRRFAWAPSAGVSGYHIELFRGSALIFRADTTRPQIVIPRRWRLGGREHRLEPGVYRWYVWPLVAGRRKSKAIVQAKLVLPR